MYRSLNNKLREELIFPEKFLDLINNTGCPHVFCLQIIVTH